MTLQRVIEYVINDVERQFISLLDFTCRKVSYKDRSTPLQNSHTRYLTT